MHERSALADLPQEAASDAASALVRLATVGPFLAYLKARRLKVKGALQDFGLTEAAVADPDRLVHAELIYGLLNAFAAEAKDPFLGVHVGEETPIDRWLFTRGAFGEKATLGNTLIRMVEAVPVHGQSTRHRLEIGSERAVYRVLRPYRTRAPAEQPDGLGMALRLRVFDHLEGGWTPASVSVRTRFPHAIPHSYRGVNITKTEEDVLDVAFPTAWCHRQMSAVRGVSAGSAAAERPLSLAAALETVLPARLHDGTSDLKAAIAADLGLEAADLDGALSRQGTSFAREVRAFRLRLAQGALAETDVPISEIASRLGFSEPANFTRFFKGETEMTPRAYRKSKQSQSRH